MTVKQHIAKTGEHNPRATSKQEEIDNFRKFMRTKAGRKKGSIKNYCKMMGWSESKGYSINCGRRWPVQDEPAGEINDNQD